MIIFLAAPFTSKVERKDKKTRLAKYFTKIIKETIAELRKDGHEVFSSHEREKWGKEIYEPAAALHDDFRNIRRCNIVLAFLGDPISPGVQMELGFSIANNKNIVVLYTQEFVDLPHLTKGMVDLPRVRFVHLKSFANLRVGALESVRLEHIKHDRSDP